MTDKKGAWLRALSRSVSRYQSLGLHLVNGAEAERVARENKDKVADEVADVSIYVLELCDILGIDISRAIEAKLEKNAAKYPVDRSRGVSTKYTDLK